MIYKIGCPNRYCLHFSRARKVLENRGITDDERVGYKSLVRNISFQLGIGNQICLLLEYLLFLEVNFFFTYCKIDCIIILFLPVKET